MTWSLAVRSTAAEIEGALVSEEPTRNAGLEGAEDEEAAQLRMARRAALALVETVGMDGEVTVALSGHANPDHTPVEGDTRHDFVTVTVYNAGTLQVQAE
jgi:hypothetical protein